MKRPTPGQATRKLGPLFKDDQFLDKYPCLHDFLTSVTYDDKSSRRTGTMLFFVDAGVLKCVLNDRDNNRSVFVERPTWEDMLDTIEAGLIDDELDWKPNKTYNSNGKETPF